MAQTAGQRIFVMGCSRGGTTVVQRTLATALNLYTLPETRFFSNLLGNAEQRLFPTTARPRTPLRQMTSRMREKLGRSTGREHVHLEGLVLPPARKWARVQRRSADFVAALDQAARAGGHAGWLEKSPTHTHYAADILRLVPEAWMVHVIRDPRDTIASIWDAAQHYADPWGIIYDRIDRAVDKWNAATRCSAAMLGMPRQIFLPYQVFTADPQAAVADIARTMGLPCQSTPGPRPVMATPAEPWKAQALDAPVQPTASKWMSALTAAERRLVTRHLCLVATEFLAQIAPPARTEAQRDVA